MASTSSVSARPDPAQTRLAPGQFRPAQGSDYVPPSATLDVIRRRAELLAQTRRFFADRDVLEVQTPLLASGLVVDAHIDPITVDSRNGTYLLPSPEAPMKRLVAAGSGAIYQIGKAFRDGERARLHQPEFTMLEWYRPGMTYDELMDEVGELMRALLGIELSMKRTYGEVFETSLGIDPHTASTEEIKAVVHTRGLAPIGGMSDRADLLDLLFATCIEPALPADVPTFIHDFPATQSALAEVSTDEPPVAQRFELIYGGMELCNGYQELLSAAEHTARFEEANATRERAGKARISPDEQLMAAIDHGLPMCSGVAVGFDRVVMLACGATHINDVLAFPSR